MFKFKYSFLDLEKALHDRLSNHLSTTQLWLDMDLQGHGFPGSVIANVSTALES